MTDAEVRWECESRKEELEKKPWEGVLAYLRSWDSPRNWFGEGEGGSWTWMASKAEYMDYLDILYVVCFITLAFVMVKSAVSGDLASAVYMIVYMLMLLLNEVYSLTERLNKILTFSSAVIDFGLKSRTLHYLKVAFATFAVYVILSLFISFGSASTIKMGEVIPLMTVTGFLGIFINIVAVPMGEELSFRGVLSAYMAEVLGVVPSVVLSGLLSGAFHWQVFNASPQFILLSILYGSIQGYVVLKERATAPCVFSHILVNALAVGLGLFKVG